MTDFSYGIITGKNFTLFLPNFQFNQTFRNLTLCPSVSDTCHAGTATDESGPAIKQLLQREYNAMKITQSTVPDERSVIENVLKQYSDDFKLNCIFTTGGTGFAPRDVTPEATKNIIHRECPQLALAMALESFKKTQFAALSR
jgi:gephyrin